MSNEQLYLDSLADIENKYRALYDSSIEIIGLDNTRLIDSLKNQVDLQLRWASLLARVNYLYYSIENDVETSYAEAISRELRDSYKSTTITEAREFAKCDAQYKVFKRLMNETKLIKDEISGVLDTVNSRKYILNNISNSVVGGVEGHII